jgi:hypothetical protein
MLILGQPVFHQYFLIITLLQVLFPGEYTTIEAAIPKLNMKVGKHDTKRLMYE